MIERLSVHDFTCFPAADLQLGALNVFVGENGTGKTHLLKLLYLFGRLGVESHFRHMVGAGQVPEFPSWRETWLQKVAERLDALFLADQRRDLVRWSAKRAVVRAWAVQAEGAGFAMAAKDGRVDGLDEPGIQSPPQGAWLQMYAAYVPARELLSVDPNLKRLYENYEVREEQTTWDLLRDVSGPRRRVETLDPRIEAVAELLERGVGAHTERDKEDGHVYLRTDKGQKVAIRLAAEGHRKLATVADLLRRAPPQAGWLLCWDEPEANLNPALIKVAAQAMVEMAAAGIQVCIATHSLFLLRELEILQSTRSEPVAARYFGLHPGKKGTTVEQGDGVEDIGDIRSLDESLAQSERFLEARK